MNIREVYMLDGCLYSFYKGVYPLYMPIANYYFNLDHNQIGVRDRSFDVQTYADWTFNWGLI